MNTAADPFGEQGHARLRARLHVLGGEFIVESDNAAFIELAIEAFGSLPRHRLASISPRFRVRLVVTHYRATWSRDAEPPSPVFNSGSGLFCATIDAGNFAVVDAVGWRALVCASPAMLRRRYHARYELIEFAFLMLAARAQGLVPLHAACVGLDGSGLLLMGSSGAGKSTLSLHALDHGMELLSEDGAFVTVDSLLVTGVPNYLHVHASALGFLEPGPLLQQIRRAPAIRRRSGTRKLEVNLREVRGRTTRTPLRLAATVFLSRRQAGRQPALRPLIRQTLLARLRRVQPYAVGLSNWREFERRIVDIPAYELRRTVHPDTAVQELQALLETVRR